MRTKEQRLSPLSAGKGTKKIINIRLPTPKIMLKGAISLDPDVTRGRNGVWHHCVIGDKLLFLNCIFF